MESHEGSATIVSTATYEAICDIFTPTNEVKKKTGELLLKGRTAGQYRLYNNMDLDGEQLELAAHLSPGATPLECQLYAKQFAAQACGSRCGSECAGECLVRAFVMVPNFGTDFYFGSAEDVAHAVLTQGAACAVYYWDDLEEDTMRKLNQHVDSLLETEPGLAMRTTQLKTVPGQVCASCLKPCSCAAFPSRFWAALRACGVAHIQSIAAPVPHTAHEALTPHSCAASSPPPALRALRSRVHPVNRCFFPTRTQVLYHCDVAAWMKFCLDHPLADPHLESKPEWCTDSQGRRERLYGDPCTVRSVRQRTTRASSLIVCHASRCQRTGGS